MINKTFRTLFNSRLLVLLLIAGTVCVQAQEKLTKYVNPFVGTDAHGHTYPGAASPFGMVQLSPDTDTKGWDWCSGYHYSDNSIIGFSHTHLSGTGCADYGDILFMPVNGELKLNAGTKNDPNGGYRSRFKHENETARPGYYSVLLDDYNIKAELTVTKRTGFHKYTFPKNEQSRIIIDLVHGIEDKTLDAEVKIIDDKTIAGCRRSMGWAKNHTVYFYAEFSKPFRKSAVVDSGKVTNAKSAKSKEVKAFVEYTTNDGETILVRIGISHSSAEGAKKNLQAEIKSWDFEAVVRETENEWEKELSTLAVESKNTERKNIFYTSLYHALLNPNLLSDVDGTYMGMDNKMHAIKNGEMYSVFSLWDTFRAAHPLFTIIDARRAGDFVGSLLRKYDEQGLLPVWELASNETGTMIGYHAVPVIFDAFKKGIGSFDPEKALEAMKKSAMQDHLGLKYYKEMGYVLADYESESVSKTLEYAYDDWCIAEMAKDPKVNSGKDAEYFTERAKNYINVFDPSTSLMRAKKNGKWVDPFDPFAVSGHYTEANAWQYSFFVPQDVNGLLDLMGGDQKFISKLDELFTADPKLTGRHQSDITGLLGQYAHGNEPSHHMAYLYNYAGAPWKAQEWVHKILTTLYTDKPDGLPGNEDCGQMSAWYVLSAAGFYPVCPGDNNYIIGSPLFDKVTINTGKSKFTVKTVNLSDENIYIQSAKLNGKDYQYSYIKHEDLTAGGELVFEMGSSPSKWGAEEKYRPVSRIEEEIIPVPYFNSGSRTFLDSTSTSIASISDKDIIYYTTDGSDPVKSKKIYDAPIIVTETGEVKAVSMRDGIFSKVVTARFTKVSKDRKVTLGTEFSHSYPGGGALGLIDGIKGTPNFHTDPWQGYEGVDVNAVIDLGEVQKVNIISASFLQNVGSWIFYPEAVEYYISADGNDFTKIYETKNSISEKNYEDGIKSFEKRLNDQDVRYIKVIGKNMGTCPSWHPGAGGKAWIFIDEITIE
jgi:predicted alpha-1,2-mannosidase